MGGPTVKAILADRFASALADRYLARTGYEAQLTPDPAPPGAPDNLFAPGDEDTDRGTHGRFDDRASATSRQAWAGRHLGLVAAAGVAAAVSLAGLVRRG